MVKKSWFLWVLGLPPHWFFSLGNHEKKFYFFLFNPRAYVLRNFDYFLKHSFKFLIFWKKVNTVLSKTTISLKATSFTLYLVKQTFLKFSKKLSCISLFLWPSFSQRCSKQQITPTNAKLNISCIFCFLSCVFLYMNEPP